MKEMGRNQQLQTGEVLIIVVVLFMWAGESGLRSTLLSPLQPFLDKLVGLISLSLFHLSVSSQRIKIKFHFCIQSAFSEQPLRCI